MAGSTQAFPVTTLLAGGGAGMMEAFCCHPLDTIKVHMQLASAPQGAQAAKRGLVHATSELVQHSPLAFYRGFGPVITGIIPKMGIRFASFELYKSILGRSTQEPLTDKQVFLGQYREIRVRFLWNPN